MPNIRNRYHDKYIRPWHSVGVGRTGGKRKQNLMRKLAIRDNARCHYCNRKLKIKDQTQEHIVPRAYGGGNTLNNNVLACGKCNNKRGCKLFYCDCEFCKTAYREFGIMI